MSYKLVIACVVSVLDSNKVEREISLIRPSEVWMRAGFEISSSMSVPLFDASARETEPQKTQAAVASAALHGEL